MRTTSTKHGRWGGRKAGVIFAAHRGALRRVFSPASRPDPQRPPKAPEPPESPPSLFAASRPFMARIRATSHALHAERGRLSDVTARTATNEGQPGRQGARSSIAKRWTSAPRRRVAPRRPGALWPLSASNTRWRKHRNETPSRDARPMQLSPMCLHVLKESSADHNLLTVRAAR